MSNIEDLQADRERKIARLRELGMNPYPAKASITHAISEVTDNFETLLSVEESVTIGGRMLAFREHGAIAFIDIMDGTGKLQAFCSREEMGEEAFTQLLETMSTGDFIEVTGPAYLTKRGTQAILMKEWRVLGKALSNIPTEHFGIKDEDERYRKRYLEILIDQEVRDVFRKKAAYWKSLRRFFEEKGFYEVHTPVLENTTGGAEARPFLTHHNDFDIDVYLRISVGELWQKRLMAAGMDKVFEVGRVFRNEGSSPDHLQEFTNLEFYAAYLNFDDGLKLIEEGMLYVLDNAFEGQRQFTMKGYEVDFSKPIEKIDYVTTVEERTGINILSASEDEMKVMLQELAVEYEGENRERLTDTLWKYCRKQIAGPVWLTGHPKYVSPLAKESADRPGTVERAQLIMAGAEFNNCYAELNDPIDQRKRFEEQAALLAQGDDEAMMPDWEFVEMLEHGMPPTFGAAPMGERFFAYLVDKPIRETQLFPLMKPKYEAGSERSEG